MLAGWCLIVSLLYAGAASATTAPPLNTSPPVISGTAQDGRTLTTASGTWSSSATPVTYRYQWQRCDSSGANCVAITSATLTTYRVTAADVGHEINVAVTATDKLAQTSQVVAAAVGPAAAPAPPVSTAAPPITGTAQDGQMLTVKSGTWSSPDSLVYSYSWQRCDNTLSNCVGNGSVAGAAYRLTPADVNHRIIATVVGTDKEGQTGQGTSIPTAAVSPPAPPSNADLPVVTGVEQAGQILHGSLGSWSSPDPLAYSYQWRRCDSSGANCVDIAGATGATYRLVSADAGQKVTDVVAATDKEGQTTAASAVAVGPVTLPPPANTAPPTISGVPQQGRALSASNGSWSSPDTLAYSYQWQRCDSAGVICTAVVGATAPSYPLTSDDNGHEIAVTVGVTDTLGQAASATTSPIGPVVAPPPPPVNATAPRISGSPADGQTLSVSNGSWSSPDTLAYSYQWQRCDSSGASCQGISGATGPSYVAGTADIGHQVAAVVTATDLEGQATPASSTSTGPIANPPPPASTAPATISGMPADGQTLSVSNGSWSSPDTLAYSYQWQRCDSSGASCQGISGATGPSYVAGTADIGHQVAAVVTATDLEGQATPASSTSTGPIANPPPPASTAPATISGMPADGQTLSVSNGSWSSPDTLAYSYQWQRCDSAGVICTAVAGATAPSYSLTSADVGHQIIATVIATDQEGQATPASVSALGPTGTPPVPASTAPPVVSGTALAGRMLMVSNGGWSSPDALAYSYQWQRCDSTGANCHSIPGATGSAYILTTTDVGSQIETTVSATDQEQQTTPATTDPYPSGSVVQVGATYNKTPPSIAGATVDGQTLSVTTGTWQKSGALTYTYEWQRCDSSGADCSTVPGATGSTYTAGAADVGHQIAAVVTGTDQSGQGASASATPVGPVGPPPAPVNGALPVVSGTATDGQTLSVSNGGWSSPDTLAYSYQWQRCDSTGANCQGISGATRSTYTLTSTDVGSQIESAVSATDQEQQTTPATSPPYPSGSVVQASPTANTAPPAISGGTGAGQTLSADPGAWSGSPPIAYTYQWQRCSPAGATCADVSGATQSSYALGAGDIGSTIRVRVTADNSALPGGGSASQNSGTTAVIAPPPPANTDLPRISGTAADGLTLSVSTGTWSSPDPLSYSYQWQRCDSSGANCQNISGAIGSTYAPSAADVAQQLTAVVTATDQEGQSTSATATPVGPVSAPPAPTNTTAPTISGRVTDGQWLSVTSGSWTSPDSLTYAYQWERCDAAGANCQGISGATGSTYMAGAADVDHLITAAVTATDQVGQGSPASAAPVGPIGKPPAPFNTAAPAISGMRADGRTLTVTTGSWSSPDTLSYSYQWQRCSQTGTNCQILPGMTRPAYTLTSADIGSQIAVTVAATDQEQQSAPPTGAAPVGPVVASSTSYRGKVLLHCTPNPAQQVDPIARFGRVPSPHMHTPSGAEAFSATATPQDMLNAPTSCLIASDHDMLWVPTPLTKSGQPATVLGSSYYMLNQGYDIERDAPVGLRYVAGDPSGVNPSGYFVCKSTGVSTRTIPTATQCPPSGNQGYELLISGPPQCWIPSSGLGIGMGGSGTAPTFTADNQATCVAEGGQPVPTTLLAFDVGSDGLGGSLSSDAQDVNSSPKPGYTAHFDFVFGFTQNSAGQDALDLIDHNCFDVTGWTTNQVSCIEGGANANHQGEAVYQAVPGPVGKLGPYVTN